MTNFAPILPLAPARFSMTTACPICSPSFRPISLPDAVGDAARRKSDDQSDLPVRVGLLGAGSERIAAMAPAARMAAMTACAVVFRLSQLLATSSYFPRIVFGL